MRKDMNNNQSVYISSRSFHKTCSFQQKRRFELEIRRAVFSAYATAALDILDTLEDRFSAKLSILELKIQIQEYKLTHVYNSNMSTLNKLP